MQSYQSVCNSSRLYVDLLDLIVMDKHSREITDIEHLPPFSLEAALKGMNLLPVGANSFL